MNIENMSEERDFDTVNGRESTVDINTDENVAGTHHLNQDLEEDDLLEKANAELQEQKDKYLRLQAEFDNFRRRSAKERIELMQTAGKDVIADMLEAVDDADRAQKQLETTDDVKLIKEGVTLVFNKLRSVLQSKGLKPMETIGKDFNPDLHEAITSVQTDEKLKGKVVDVVEKGFLLNDKVIRFAKVVTGS